MLISRLYRLLMSEQPKGFLSMGKKCFGYYSNQRLTVEKYSGNRLIVVHFCLFKNQLIWVYAVLKCMGFQLFSS